MSLPLSRRSTRQNGVPQPRLYRLVELPGLPHPSLDGLYDSAEEAWCDAQHWWQSGGSRQASGCGAIGVEVSTAAGQWRTLLLRCPVVLPAMSPPPWSLEGPV